MIRYRDAVSGDAAPLADLFRESFVDTFGHLYPPDDLAAFLATKHAERFAREIADARFAFRLAEDDGTLAGYIKLCPPELPVETPPDSIELSQFYILRPWHGRGIAQALMEWALAKSAERGARHIQLSVYIDNYRARRFYERYGFKAVGRYDFMVGNHADEDVVLRHVVMDVAP